MPKQTFEKKIVNSSLEFDDKFPVICSLCQLGNHDLNKLHSHNFFEIALCLGGNGVTMIENTMFSFKEDDIFFIFPNQPHMSQSPNDSMSSWCYIFFDINRLFFDYLEIRNMLELDVITKQSIIFNKLSGTKAKPLVQLLKTVISEFQGKGYAHQNIIKHLLISFLFMTTKFTSRQITKTTNSSQYITIAPVLNFINSHYAQDISVDNMAKIANISTGHFRRIFKQTMGCTPIEHLRSVRLNMAKTLVRSTSNSMSYICTQVGFDNISTFNRYFKQKFGVTPTAYRKG